MEKFEITFGSQLANSRQILIYFLLCSIAAFVTQNGDLKSSIEFFSIFFFVQLLPQLALHWNYFVTNKNDQLIYDASDQSLLFKHGDKEVRFSLKDIESAIMHKSFALQKKNIPFLAWDSYNHTIIRLNNGTLIVITSLMIGGELDLPLEVDKIKIKMNLFRWVNGSSLRL